MKLKKRFLFLVCLTAITLIGTGCSKLQDVGITGSTPNLTKITPKTGNPVLTLSAKGDQVFRCTVDSKGGYWRAERPDAALYDSQGKQVGTLSGPMSAFEGIDGSKIISSQLIAWTDPQDPKTTIKYALFKAFSDPGNGMFDDVQYIQRINPRGGMPSSEQNSKCNDSTKGRLLKVPFSADFVFWK